MPERQRPQPTVADLQAKARSIEVYFDDLQAKASFSKELYDEGHRNEAMILSCVYIEALGSSLYWPQPGARRCFAQVLIDHSGESVFSLVHPRALVTGLRGNSKTVEIADILDQGLSLQPPELHPIPDLMSLARSYLNDEQFQLLEANIWCGTLAAIAYKRLQEFPESWKRSIYEQAAEASAKALKRKRSTDQDKSPVR